MKIQFLPFFVVLLLLFPFTLHAQDQISNEGDRRTQLNNPQVTAEELSSLFLTDNEIFQLRQAAQNLLTRPPTNEEVENEEINDKIE